MKHQSFRKGVATLGRSLAGLVLALAVMCVVPGTAAAQPAPGDKLAAGFPSQIQLRNQSVQFGTRCVYYDETRVWLADALENSTCDPALSSVFNTIMTPDGWARFELAAHPGRCLIADPSRDPQVGVGSCGGGQELDWGGGGPLNSIALYPRPHPTWWLCAIVNTVSLQQPPNGEPTLQEYKWAIN
ncbi:hypothetical protein F5X71_31515 [Nocardia brasiliensis]|uniref:Ricin B lectin domain-containing protein n=1 Tax=Nocardia brasiliensis TaxID=37326 RepID=A0A6G9XZ83_NOCBR|nr:hypothetical protein [Nocardia brasiliensis]QIS06231.1 hypothetical protein F5X71_31515 [Nocardia brasiliensis]